MATTKQGTQLRSRYEFRVWGDPDSALDRLSSLADTERDESFEDCYLLVQDPSCNLKIRRNRLKVKRLVEERFGFQRWSTDWHRISVDPGRDRSESTGGMMDPEAIETEQQRNQTLLADVVTALDPTANLRPVFVTKYRRRFRFGSMRAEVADLEIGGRSGRLCTTAIEGRNLLDLIQLRSALGLDLTPNVAVHLALDLRQYNN